MNLEEDYRKAQRDGTFELYGFFVSNRYVVVFKG